MKLKKAFYILLSLFSAFVVYCVAYAEYDYNFRLNMINEALENKEYYKIAGIYETFYDSKSKVEDVSDKTDFYIYPSTFQTAIQYSDGINHIDYEKSYSFYFFNNNFQLNTVNKKNASAIRFITNSGYYDYYFIVNTGINKEILISEPATIEEALINTGRDYPVNNNELGFINISFSETMLEGITKLANGKEGSGEINKIQIIDSVGQIVLEHNILFDFNDEFFIDNAEIISYFNDAYNRYKDAKDEVEKTKIKAEFETKLDEWTNEFKGLNHPSYKLGLDESDLTSKKVQKKTSVIMIIFVIIDVLGYILFFHWYRIVDFMIKHFNMKEPAGWKYRSRE